MRNVGNRRSEEELLKIQAELNEDAYKLEEQDDFKGTEEELVYMQNLERFYMDGMPKVSDEEWEVLKYKFNYKESSFAASPSGRMWKKLLAPLPSINKAPGFVYLDEFFSKFPEDQVFKVEGKLDGVTANVVYNLNKEEGIYEFDCITTRGNGRYGLKCHDHALDGVHLNFPKKLSISNINSIIEKFNKEYGRNYELNQPVVELRGEAVIPKGDCTFARYGESAVWRSVAAGMMNRKVPYNLNGILMNYDINTLDGQRALASLAEVSNITSGDVEYRPLKRGDKAVVVDKKFVEISYSNGDAIKFIPAEEYLDIIFYSMSLDGSNIDIGELAGDSSIKTLKDVSICNEQITMSDEEIKLTKECMYYETSNRDYIKEIIARFYGTDLNEVPTGAPRLRNLYKYAMDGVVIKPMKSDNTTQDMQLRASRNNPNKFVIPKYPEDMVAIKLSSTITRVKLEKIVFNKTDLNNITCTGILDKEYLTESGAKISKINLHNPEWLEENSWIKEGCEYDMVMSQDIIPALVR